MNELERIGIILQVPLRTDGNPDLNNWREFIRLNGCKTLSELLALGNNTTKEFATDILLAKAVSAKRNEIADSLVKALFEEELTTQEAISLLDVAKTKIMGYRFTP